MNSLLVGMVRDESLNRLRRCRKDNCGFRAARGLLFFACAKKSNQKKAHPVARRLFEPVPCAPRSSRALRNSPELPQAIRTQTVLAQTPGSSCGARRAPTGREAKSRDFDFDVDFQTRCRRRASQPRPGVVASRCSSPKRVVQRPASSARARPGREAQGVSAAPGRAFFWLLFFARAKKSNPPPRGQRQHSRSSVRDSGHKSSECRHVAGMTMHELCAQRALHARCHDTPDHPRY